MTLTIWGFFGHGETPASESELSSIREALAQTSPPGSRIEVRPLDYHYMVMDAADDEAPLRPQFMEGLSPHLDARVSGTIWLPAELANSEVAAAETLDTVERLGLPLVTSVVCHSRVHLDLLGDGESPEAYVVVPITRAANTSRDEFAWYYRSHHVPVAMSADPLFVRYSTHRVLHASGGFAQDTVTVQEYRSLGDIDRHVRARLEATKDTTDRQKNYFAKVDYYSGDRASEVCLS